MEYENSDKNIWKKIKPYQFKPKKSLKAAEALQGDSLLLITKPPVVSGIHWPRKDERLSTLGSHS